MPEWEEKTCTNTYTQTHTHSYNNRHTDTNRTQKINVGTAWWPISLDYLKLKSLKLNLSLENSWKMYKCTAKKSDASEPRNGSRRGEQWKKITSRLPSENLFLPKKNYTLKMKIKHRKWNDKKMWLYRFTIYKLSWISNFQETIWLLYPDGSQ